MKKVYLIITIVIILIIVAGGVYFLMRPKTEVVPVQTPTEITETQSTQQQEQTQEQTKPQTSTSYYIKGMKVEIIKEGSGETAKSGDLVTVNYTGTLTNGTKFDSSINPGREPFQFTLGQNKVIQGWELGVLGMKIGEKRKLTIPPELGYGSQAVGGVIPANSTLIFEIDLLGLNK